MGNCANAPMVQINDDNFEDLTYDSTTAILSALEKGESPKAGPQIDRLYGTPGCSPSSYRVVPGRAARAR